jgi:hypothetical protein
MTFDEQLYCKAKMLLWDRDSWKDLVVILRGFNTQMNFNKVLGRYMDYSGLENVCIESGVLGNTTNDEWKKMASHHLHTQADVRST